MAIRGAWALRALYLGALCGLWLTAPCRADEMEDALSHYGSGAYLQAETLWLELATRDSDPEAMYRLGLLAEEGHLSAGGSDAASVWFRRAANYGHVEALYRLGLLYWEGRGVVEGKSLAVTYWRDAAEIGLTDAQYRLGLAYLRGDGVERDDRKARFWLQCAVAQGLSEARKVLGQLAGGLSPESALSGTTAGSGEAFATAGASFETRVEQAQESASQATESQATESQATESQATESQATESQSDGSVPENRVDGFKHTETGEPLRIYAYRSTAGAVLMALAPGMSITELDRDGDWVRVKVDTGILGWVSAEWLTIEGDVARAKSNVRVRLLPEVSDRAAPFGDGLRTGESVTVVERQEDWARVRLPDRYSAWVRAVDLR